MNEDSGNQREPAGPWRGTSQGAVSVHGAWDSGTYSGCPEAGAQFPKKLGNQEGRGSGSFCRRRTVCFCDGGLVLVAAVGVATVVCLRSC